MEETDGGWYGGVSWLLSCFDEILMKAEKRRRSLFLGTVKDVVTVHSFNQVQM